MALWSVRYKPVSMNVEPIETICKVCKASGNMTLLKENKVVRIFFIPVSVKQEISKVCPNCSFRQRVEGNSELLDA